jgi:ribosomal protein S18 acetylase RimI-like enzyme
MMTTDPAGLTLRRATVDDASVVAELARRTFVEAFGAKSDPHDLALHSARSYGVAQQAAELAHPGMTTLLAEVGGRPAAYAQIRRITPPACVPDASAVEISRFYVDQPWHGQGLAQRLMSACLDRAREMGAGTAWLMVYEHNHRALAFYTREGFREVGRHGFIFGNALELDRVLVRTLDGRADATDTAEATGTTDAAGTTDATGTTGTPPSTDTTATTGTTG